MVPSDENFLLLQSAIARNTSIVLSLPSAGALRHHKSRLLHETDDGFWVESSHEEVPLVEELMRTGKAAGVSFRHAEQKVMFTASVIGRDPAFQVNPTLQIDALLMKMPEKVVVVQRRSTYRVRISEEEEVRMRIWRVPPRATVQDRPAPSAEVGCKLINLSPGGAGVMLIGQGDQPPIISTQDRLRLELTINDNAVVVEGCMRYPESPPREATYRAGIQFISMEDNLKGRQAEMQLTRLIGELQRRELRQMRMGLGRP